MNRANRPRKPDFEAQRATGGLVRSHPAKPIAGRGTARMWLTARHSTCVADLSLLLANCENPTETLSLGHFGAPSQAFILLLVIEILNFSVDRS
jgi:hypothetical protein